MKKSIIYCALASATAIGISACSSDSDVAGIGGTGVTSSGTITGFGSVFVNGVEFETDSSTTISVDDNPGIESDLAIGMRVTVDGTVNSDRVTGTATSISFDDDLQGPVGAITENQDQTVKTFSVVGRTVNVSSTNTSFDISGSNSALAGVTFDYATITPGQYVEISGFLDSNGVMNATRVELKDTTFDFANELVEIRGTISGLDTTNETFTLEDTANLIIDTSLPPVIDNSLVGGLANGAFVEVKGKCSDANCTTVIADKIESGFEDFDDNDDVELEGVITRFVDDSDFDVNGFPVDASTAEKKPTSLVLALDKQVEVEGTVDNGVLIADEVEDEGGEIKIAATVAAGTVNASTSSFELEPVPGQTITVMIDTSTELEDESDTIISLATLFENLNDGDYVVVEGYDDGTGKVIASKVKRKTPEDVILQGIMESFTPDQEVIVLGVSFQVVQPAETTFEDANDASISQAVFDEKTTPGVTLIKIKDQDANSVADEIEIED